MGAMMPGMQQEVRNRILLCIDELQLMLPQGEVCAVESAADVRRDETLAPAIGQIVYLGQSWPVLCLDGEFTALDALMPGRRACVMLATGQGFLGILCDDVRVLKQSGTEDYSLPVAMRTANTPVQALMQFESGLACISDTSHLLQFGAMAKVLQQGRR